MQIRHCRFKYRFLSNVTSRIFSVRFICLFESGNYYDANSETETVNLFPFYFDMFSLLFYSHHCSSMVTF